MYSSIGHGAGRNPFGDETKQLVTKRVSRLRMEEGLNHEARVGRIDF